MTSSAQLTILPKTLAWIRPCSGTLHSHRLSLAMQPPQSVSETIRFLLQCNKLEQSRYTHVKTILESSYFKRLPTARSRRQVARVRHILSPLLHRLLSAAASRCLSWCSGRQASLPSDQSAVPRAGPVLPRRPPSDRYHYSVYISDNDL